jgi:hypothetical protein
MATDLKLTELERARVLAQRRFPDLSSEEIDEMAEEWCADAAADREYIEDTPCLENGRDNCDDWGTGEGRYHGRF